VKSLRIEEYREVPDDLVKYRSTKIKNIDYAKEAREY
jgi:hypothetical protein